MVPTSKLFRSRDRISPPGLASEEDRDEKTIGHVVIDWLFNIVQQVCEGPAAEDGSVGRTYGGHERWVISTVGDNDNAVVGIVSQLVRTVLRACGDIGDNGVGEEIDNSDHADAVAGPQLVVIGKDDQAVWAGHVVHDAAIDDRLFKPLNNCDLAVVEQGDDVNLMERFDQLLVDRSIVLTMTYTAISTVREVVSVVVYLTLIHRRWCFRRPWHDRLQKIERGVLRSYVAEQS